MYRFIFRWTAHPIITKIAHMKITRRAFLQNASVILGASTRPLLFGAQSNRSPVTLRIGKGTPGLSVSKDFIGLSYESMQLEDASFFSPRNASLIEQFRAISLSGVLRLGGNTSEFGWWKAKLTDTPPERHVVLNNGNRPADSRVAGVSSPTLFLITPETILQLNGFLQDTGWTCIYGLNLGYGNPDVDIPEARFVFETLGPRLQYFQIGNEIDNFVRYGLREESAWNVDQYLQEWLRIARAVQKILPQAKFGMPDVARDMTWPSKIADRWPSVEDKPNVIMLSHHHYWGGPPNDPNATIEQLLLPDSKVIQQADVSRQAAAKMGISYRMTEGNTVFRGGKPGVSDVFASALWTVDYVLQLMVLGYSGVNLHGGSGHAQAVSVGGSFVGEALMKNPNEPHPKPFYTPIANEGTLAGSGVNGKLNDKYLLEPVGYGLRFANMFAGYTFVPVEFNPGTVNAVAYGARDPNGKVIIAIVNKDATQDLKINTPPCQVEQVLTAPSLDAKEAHILTGQQALKFIPIRVGSLTVPKHTAVLISLM
jgi:hypothetical protein